MIVRKLRAAGLPEELSWLPLVESGFKLRALSSAHALGMWQFISSTGSRYGLDRSHWIDERMDPEKSTDAAIAYLTDLHGMFGDWTTALASYNCGENRVKSLMRRQKDGHLDGFWDVFNALPSETARYVPRFLATLAIVRNPEAYGMVLPEPDPAIDFETVTVSRHFRLIDLDEALGLERDALAAARPPARPTRCGCPRPPRSRSTSRSRRLPRTSRRRR
jgi:membrane-bound lytic murein transglycosylase D